MKEYLTKNSSGNYQLVNHRFSEDDIEVPDGADAAFKKKYGDGLCFFQCVGENGADWCSETKKWISRIHPVDDWYFKNSPWQRHTQPEELPFIDDEQKIKTATGYQLDVVGKNTYGSRSRESGESDTSYRQYLMNFKIDQSKSLNDQYAEIERVRQQTIEATLAERQAQYGCFEDVARTTGRIMEALSEVRVNGLNDLPHTHRMALYMIASKMARIVNGDFNYRDNWHDIGGYSKLIEDLL